MKTIRVHRRVDEKLVIVPLSKIKHVDEADGGADIVMDDSEIIQANEDPEDIQKRIEAES